MKKNHINQNDIIDLRKLFKIILGKKKEEEQAVQFLAMLY